MNNLKFFINLVYLISYITKKLDHRRYKYVNVSNKSHVAHGVWECTCNVYCTYDSPDS